MLLWYTMIQNKKEKKLKNFLMGGYIKKEIPNRWKPFEISKKVKI